jgi:threonine dehydrogenase-like Zn-dependent dehydrogenase
MFAGGGMKIIGQNPETPGGFGEFFLLDETLLKPVRSDLPSETVCVSDAVAVGWSAAKRAQVSPKDVPLVIGCGAIALSVIATLKRLGAGPVLAADFVPSRRALALAMGADVVIDPQEVSPFQVWRDVTIDSHRATKNMMAAAGSSACVVIECVGVPGVLESIIRGCERGTRIMSLGGAPEGDHLSTLTAKRKGLNIQFGGGPLPEHWNEAFEAVCSGSLDVSPLLGRTVGLEEVPEALNAARDANGPARIVVVPDAKRPGQ